MFLNVNLTWKDLLESNAIKDYFNLESFIENNVLLKLKYFYLNNIVNLM